MRIIKQRLLEMIPDLSVFLDVDGQQQAAHEEPSTFVPAIPTHLLPCAMQILRKSGTSRDILKEHPSSSSVR